MRRGALLAGIVSSAAALFLSGAGWGLPCEARARPFFPDAAELAWLIPRMAEARPPIEGTILDHNRSLDASARAAGKSPLHLPSERLPEGDPALAILRALRMAPPHYGESHALAALASMRPGKWDFDPHTVVYGGLFLYTIGAALAGAEAAGLVELSTDPAFYLAHPEAMGRILRIARGVVVAAALVSVALLWRLSLVLSGSAVAATLAAVLFLLSPATMTNAWTLAPHAFALPFFLAGLLALARMRRSAEPNAHARAAALWMGLATASAVYYGLGFLPLVLSRRISPRRTLLYLAAAAALFLAVNPYLLLRWERTLGEYRTWIVAEHADPVSFGVTASHLAWFFLFVLPSSANFAAAPFLVAGIVRLLRDRATRWLLPIAAGGVGYQGFMIPFGVTEHVGRHGLFLIALLLATGAAQWRQEWRRRPRVATCVAGLACAWAAAAGLFVVAHHRRGDSPDANAIRAGEWIEANIPPGARIWMNQVPHPFLSPRFDIRRYDLTICRSPEEWREATGGHDWFIRMVRSDDRLDALLSDHVVAARFERPVHGRRFGVTSAFCFTEHDFEILRPLSPVR